MSTAAAGLDRTALQVGALFARARAHLGAGVLPILGVIAGWAGVWALVELLVFRFAPTPLGPLWLVLHVGYFWGSAFWEAAMLRVALDAVDGRPLGWWAALRDPRLATHLFVLKLAILPALLLGLALLFVPGVYLVARFGAAFFHLVEGEKSPWVALRRADRATRGHRGVLVATGLVLLLLNMLGAALMGVGLLLTVPFSALVAAAAFRALGSERSAFE